jgi:hypothetical protein
MAAVVRLHMICLLVSRLVRTSPLEDVGLFLHNSGEYRHTLSVLQTVSRSIASLLNAEYQTLS